MTLASPRLVSVRPIWGTVIQIEVCDPIEECELEPVWHWFERVDDLFSTWRADSEITRLARGELELDDTSAEVRVVLALCEEMKRTSGGAFDIGFAGLEGRAEAPGRCAIDPTGLVKGWAVDRAGELLDAAGAANYAINAGGDVLVRGRPRAGAAWRVGIRHPWQRDKTAAVVGVIDAAVATSGDYERGDHIVDPRTAAPARGLASVTVVASQLAVADAYATAAVALGSDGMAWLASRPGVSAMGITDDRRVVKTAGFADLVVQ